MLLLLRSFQYLAYRRSEIFSSSVAIPAWHMQMSRNSVDQKLDLALMVRNGYLPIGKKLSQLPGFRYFLWRKTFLLDTTIIHSVLIQILYFRYHPTKK